MFDFFSDPKAAAQVDFLIRNIPFAVWETLYSTVIASVFAYLIGLPLGVVLVTGARDGIRPLPAPLMQALNMVVNLLRSVPFLILMVLVMPLSRVILGTTIGTPGILVPLTVAAFPFAARLVESSLREMDKGLIEAAQSMGCSTLQIVWKVMLSCSFTGNSFLAGPATVLFPNGSFGNSFAESRFACRRPRRHLQSMASIPSGFFIQGESDTGTLYNTPSDLS